jgi:hypothetical protein
MPNHKGNIIKPTDKQLLSLTRGVPFKRCENCGKSIITSTCYCGECLRLTELGMTPAVKQFKTTQTQAATSYPSGDHTGYFDQIPTGNLPASKKGRVQPR